MTVGFHKLNQMVMPIAVALSNVVLLLEQISIFPGIWYGAIDLANALCSLPVSKEHQKQFVFTEGGPQCTCMVLSQGYVNPSALCRNIGCRDLIHLIIPLNFKLAHNTDVFIGPGKHEASG